MSLIGDREPTRAEVDMLADVIADGYLSGVRYGPDSLARHVLRAGYRLVEDKMPAKSPVRRAGRVRNLPHRVVLVVDEPGVRDVVDVAGAADRRMAEHFASALVKVLRELYPWRDVYQCVLPADVSAQAWLDILPMQLGPPYPTVRELAEGGQWEAWCARLRYRGRLAEMRESTGGSGCGAAAAAAAAAEGP